MLDLKSATTMEIQLERDNCHAMVGLMVRSYLEGVITLSEFLNQAAPYQKRYEECLAQLLQDWAWANEVAKGLK